MWERYESLNGLFSICHLRFQTDQTGNNRYTEIWVWHLLGCNLPGFCLWQKPRQFSALSVCQPCPGPFALQSDQHLIRSLQHPPSVLPGADRQHQAHRDNLSITLLGARHTRAPMAPKSGAALQQSVPGETPASSGAEIVLQVHRRFKHQPVTEPTNARDKQMAKDKCRDLTNRNQGNMTASEPNSLTTTSPRSPNTAGKIYLDLKSLIMIY